LLHQTSVDHVAQCLLHKQRVAVCLVLYQLCSWRVAVAGFQASSKCFDERLIR
jgi:hypothetical protein